MAWAFLGFAVLVMYMGALTLLNPCVLGMVAGESTGGNLMPSFCSHVSGNRSEP